MTSARLPRAAAAAAGARPSAVEEEPDDEPVRRHVAVDKTVAVTTVSEGRGSQSDVTSLKEGAPPESHDMETDRRRRRVLALLQTAEGQQMVRQMYAARDELKRELAGLAQRLKLVDSQIEAMLRAGST